MHSDNEQGVPTTSRVADLPPAVAPTAFNNLSPRKDDNSEESRGFARGGNSIFGEPMVRDKKNSKLTSGIKMPLMVLSSLTSSSLFYVYMYSM